MSTHVKYQSLPQYAGSGLTDQQLAEIFGKHFPNVFWTPRQLAYARAIAEAARGVRAVPQPRHDDGSPAPEDTIAKCKRILAAVDAYHEQPTQATRSDLRRAIYAELEAAFGVLVDENAGEVERLLDEGKTTAGVETSNRPSREWYAAKIAETEGLDDNLPSGALAGGVATSEQKRKG